ncbi:MAG: response regulator transcription factor [Pseudomonadota bacterium]
MHVRQSREVLGERRPSLARAGLPLVRPQPDAAKAPRDLLLVDDHAIIREGIKRILEPIAAHWSITESDSAFKALECLRKREFALAIVDLSLPGMPGLELIRRIRLQYPSVAVMVLTMHDEEQYAVRAFKAGATGYLTKDSATTGLLTAVEKVASGGIYLPPGFAERVVQQVCGLAESPRHSALSDRELDVLQRIVAGERLTDIASTLHLSVKTVSTHKARIQEKLQLASTAALIRYSMEHRLFRSNNADPTE